MAKWAGPITRKRPPVKKYLYLQCDCVDSQYGPAKGWSPEAFLSRYFKAQQVWVARPTDLLIPIAMSKEREIDRCAWMNELGQYEFLTIKLQAIEKAIVKTLGKQSLRRIKNLYEREMAERILKSREH